MGPNNRRLSRANSNISLTVEEKEDMIDKAAFHYAEFMKSLRIDFENDPHSSDTPRRVAKSFVNDLMRGCYSDEPNITEFTDPDMYDGIVFQGDIEVKSMCSHHHLAFTGKAYIAYLPGGNEGDKIIGLSKLNRIVEFFSRRPQVQESLTSQVHDYISKRIENNRGVMVMIKANHTCCSHRGVGHNSTMQTAKPSGYFLDNKDGIKDEFWQMVNQLK